MGLVMKDDGWRVPDAFGCGSSPCCQRGRRIRWAVTTRAFPTEPP